MDPQKAADGFKRKALLVKHPLHRAELFRRLDDGCSRVDHQRLPGRRPNGQIHLAIAGISKSFGSKPLLQQGRLFASGQIHGLIAGEHFLENFVMIGDRLANFPVCAGYQIQRPTAPVFFA